jgi:2-(1,2-epoxy-1,2-dihydrophenyl)acetyl-CoA isomerase
MEPTRRIMNGAQRLVAAVLDCNKPVIAVVHGAATGLGAHVVYASDLVIATENAYFAESFVKRGLVVDGGGCYLLPRRIGMQKAKEMAFFGEKLSAAEALTLGLVNRVVSVSDLDATVADFAGRLAGAPTSAIAFTKRLLNDSPDTDRSGAFVAEAMSQEIQSYAHDSTEGVKAFMEKRPTEFTGW